MGTDGIGVLGLGVIFSQSVILLYKSLFGL